MSTRNKFSKGEGSTNINISPMIDMVFILLIFFIVTTVFVEEAGIDVDKPTIDKKIQTTPTEVPIMLKVTVSNQIYFNGDPINMSSVEPMVSNALAADDELPVVMQVEKGALSGTMIEVMDRAKLGGAGTITVTSLKSKS